ncbi:MAG: arsenate reductase family protein [Solirubrobacteraceae bacterium]
MLKVYLKPTCSKCQAVVELLRSEGIDFEEIDYYASPLTPARLAGLAAKAEGGIRSLVRTVDRPELATSEETDEELLAVIADDPDLVGRPIVELGDRALVARPPERALELLGG